MSQNKLFRTRLFGYKKRDVNSYILEASEKSKTKLNEQYDKTDALIQENYALRDKVSELEAKIAELNTELSDFREKKEVISSAILSAELRAADILKDAEQKKAETEVNSEEASSDTPEEKQSKSVIRPAVRLKRIKGGF